MGFQREVLEGQALEDQEFNRKRQVEDAIRLQARSCQKLLCVVYGAKGAGSEHWT